MIDSYQACMNSLARSRPITLRLSSALLRKCDAKNDPFEEVWIYDDCSTDDTSTIAKRLGAKIVKGDFSRGCTFAKRTLVQRTSCKWVHFHDADDLLLPNFMATALNLLALRSITVT